MKQPPPAAESTGAADQLLLLLLLLLQLMSVSNKQAQCCFLPPHPHPHRGERPAIKTFQVSPFQLRVLAKGSHPCPALLPGFAIIKHNLHLSLPSLCVFKQRGSLTSKCVHQRHTLHFHLLPWFGLLLPPSLLLPISPHL